MKVLQTLFYLFIYFCLQNYASANEEGVIKHLPKTPVAQTDSISFDKKNKNDFKMESLHLTLPCHIGLDSRADLLIDNLLIKHSQRVKNIYIRFDCDKKNKQVIYPLPDWMTTLDSGKKTKKQNTKRVHFLFPSIGYGNVNYKEGNILDSSYKQTFINIKYRNLLYTPKWHVDFEAKYALSDSSDDLEEYEPRILDIDLRLGRGLSYLEEPWHFRIFAGIFYTQMFVKNDSFGYKGTYYPQVYPELRRIYENGNALNFYLKYVPTGSDKQAIGVGGSYLWNTNTLPVLFQLNYTNFQFQSDTNSTDVEINQFNFSIGSGF